MYFEGGFRFQGTRAKYPRPEHVPMKNSLMLGSRVCISRPSLLGLLFRMI